VTGQNEDVETSGSPASIGIYIVWIRSTSFCHIGAKWR